MVNILSKIRKKNDACNEILSILKLTLKCTVDKMKILDVVVLTEPIPSLNLRKGELGTIVEELDKDVFLVEFADSKGVTYAMPVLNTSVLMKVYYEPIAA